MYNDRMRANTPQSLKARIQVQENGCWLYPGEPTKNGYVRLNYQRRKIMSHRFFYEHLRGIIPDDKECDHLCKNRSCCNPNHIELVDRATNARKQDHFLRSKTHCPQGHAYDEANTVYTTRQDGGKRRHCRECMRLYNAKKYQEKMADPEKRAIIAESAKRRYHKRKYGHDLP